MALADDIRSLRDRVLADLNAAHDYYHDRPSAWFAYLEDKVKLGCPMTEEIDRIAEAKASRDVLIYNRGIAGKIYEWKAGPFARYKAGERIDISEAYHRQTWICFAK